MPFRCIEANRSALMRKPAFCIFEYNGADLLRGNHAYPSSVALKVIEKTMNPVCVEPGLKPPIGRFLATRLTLVANGMTGRQHLNDHHYTNGP